MALVLVPRLRAIICLAAATALSAPSPALANVEPGRVVATSKPVHSLVALVMLGADAPALLVDGSASPHSYSMKPSDAAKAHRAKLLFRLSESLEPFTAKLIRTLPRSTKVVTLGTTPGLKLLRTRRAGPFSDRHEHHGHRHDDARRNDFDPHIWLDVANARTMSIAIRDALARYDPANAAKYAANTATLAQRLEQLTARLSQELAPVKGHPFLLSHDATQYFERQFGLTAIGTIALTPEQRPGARRLSELRRKVRSFRAGCVFGEPGVQQGILNNVVEGTKVRIARLDPEGLTLESGPELYFRLMDGLSASMRSCLNPTPPG